MQIVYKKGNMFEGPEKFLLHGCNSKGVMNSGVAKELRRRYPEAFNVYRKQYEAFLKMTASGIPVGNYSFVEVNRIGIFNLVTQENYGYDGKCYFSYEGFQKGLESIDKYFYSLKYYYKVIDPEVAMPKIGAGLAGGDWSKISTIIESTVKNFQPVVYEFSPLR